MNKTREKTTQLSITAMLVAVEFILTRYLKIMLGNSIRISFGFVATAMIGILYGPLWSGLAMAASDYIGANLFPVGPYHYGFTLSAFLTGAIFGLFLYKRDISIKTLIIPCFLVVFGVNLLLDTLWLAQIMNKGILILLPARVIKSLIMFPIEILFIYTLWNKVMVKIPYVKTLRANQMKQ